MVPLILKDVWKLRNILVVVFTPILLLPLVLNSGGSESACAYVVIVTAVFWITEAMPIAVTSLLPIFLLPVVGVMPAKSVSSAYMNDTSMLFIGGLMVAAAIEHWDIHKRIALRVLLFAGSEPRWLMLGLMLPTWFLSMWISNTATTAMMVPIANAVLVQLRQAKQTHEEEHTNPTIELEDIQIKGQGEKDIDNNQQEVAKDIDAAGSKELLSPKAEDDAEHLRMCKALSLCIAYSANVGGIASLTGTFPNIVMKGQADIVFQRFGGESPITFNTWMLFGLPASFIVLVILWAWLTTFLLRCRGCCTKSDPEMKMKIKTVILNEYKKLGTLSFAQIAVMGHFLLLAVLWITRNLGGAGGWGDMFKPKYATDSTPSIFVGMLLFVFPASIPALFCCRSVKKDKQNLVALLDWKTAQEKIPWGVFLLLGGGFALAKASEESGLSDWLGVQLHVLSGLQPWVMNLVLCYIATFATEVTSNTAICTLIMPILARLALNLRVNPLYFMFPASIATSFAFMLPVATPPNAIVFSYGYLRVIDMCMSGFVMNILSVLILVLATETWGAAYFDFHTFSSIFQTNITTTTMMPGNTTLCTI